MAPDDGSAAEVSFSVPDSASLRHPGSVPNEITLLTDGKYHFPFVA